MTFTYRPRWADQPYRWWVDQRFRIHAPDRLPTAVDESDALAVDESDALAVGESGEEHTERLHRGVAAAQEGDGLSAQDLGGSGASSFPHVAEAFERFGPLSPQAERDPVGAFAAFIATLQGQHLVGALPEGELTDTRSKRRAKPRTAADAFVRGLPQPPVNTILDIVLTQCASEALGHLGVRVLRALTELSGLPLLSLEAPITAERWMTPTACVLSLDVLLRLMRGVDAAPIWDDAAVPVTPEALATVWDALLDLSRITVSGMVRLPAEGQRRERREQRSAPLVRIVASNLDRECIEAEELRTPTWARLELPWGSWLWRTLV